MFRTLMAASLLTFVTHSSAWGGARGFIGDTGTGWNTTSKVQTRASSQHTGDGRLAINTINGSGLDSTGTSHNNNQGGMWLGLEPSGPSRFGTSPGGHWIEFRFDRVYQLEEMWIWNYAEGDPGGYAWSAQGIRHADIHYTSVNGPGGWGSLSSSDWVEIFSGEFDVYDPGQPRTANMIIDFAHVSAKYVVINTSPVGNDLNWVCDKNATFCPNDDAGLSEVRFYAAPDPIPHSVLNYEGTIYLEFSSIPERAHHLHYSTSPLTSPSWNVSPAFLQGNGSSMYFADQPNSDSRVYRIAVE